MSGKKRLHDDRDQSAVGEARRGRKRVKFSNKELCIEAHPHLRDYAKQRSLEFLGPNLYQGKLQQVSDFELKPLAKQVGISDKFLRERQSQEFAFNSNNENEGSEAYSELDDNANQQMRAEA